MHPQEAAYVAAVPYQYCKLEVKCNSGPVLGVCTRGPGRPLIKDKPNKNKSEINHVKSTCGLLRSKASHFRIFLCPVRFIPQCTFPLLCHTFLIHFPSLMSHLPQPVVSFAPSFLFFSPSVCYDFLKHKIFASHCSLPPLLLLLLLP